MITIEAGWREMAKMLPEGVILWRGHSVSEPGFSGGSAYASTRAHEVDFARTEKHGKTSHMCRTTFGSDSCSWMHEPTVHFNESVRNKGTVTFLDELPPDGWTFLRFKRASREGNAIFAEYGGTIPEDVVTRMWLSSYHAVRPYLNGSASEKMVGFSTVLKAYQNSGYDFGDHKFLFVSTEWRGVDAPSRYVPAIEVFDAQGNPLQLGED